MLNNIIKDLKRLVKDVSVQQVVKDLKVMLNTKKTANIDLKNKCKFAQTNVNLQAPLKNTYLKIVQTSLLSSNSNLKLASDTKKIPKWTQI
jgi:alkyl sulfatase BDS1-like metallo-beta-lactamase superfamily hydrolase